MPEFQAAFEPNGEISRVASHADCGLAALLLNPSESRTQNFRSELMRRGWHVAELSCEGWSETFRGLRNFLRVARQSQFILSGPGFPWQSLWLTFARLLGRKTVVDCPMDITTAPFPEARHWKLLVSFSCRRADAFLTLASRDYLVGDLNLDPSKVLFLENCPDLEQIRRAETATPRVRPPSGTKLLGYSGVAPWQRPDRFVPVFKAVLKLLPNVRWLIVSDLESPMIERLRQCAAEAGVLEAIDFSPLIKPPEEFFATMAQCDIWVGHLGDDTKQGKHELRMELLEMGAMGKAAAFTSTPALQRHGFKDDEHVILIKPEDAKWSASRLAGYLSNQGELERIGSNLRRHVLDNFSLAESVDKILEHVQRNGKGRRDRRSNHAN